jgi:hypothetical protein
LGRCVELAVISDLGLSTKTGPDVRDCAERCEDRVNENTLADKLDACTDCIDRGYSCSEIVDKCSACDDVQVALER